MTRVRVLALLGLVGVLTIFYGIVENAVANEIPNVSLWILSPILIVSAGLFITVGEWARLRRDVARSAESTDDAAKELAAAVQAQWIAESQLRLLEQPQPIRVRWRRSEGDHASHPGGLAALPREGDLATVIETFVRLQTQQLCVLGRPGSGKSVLVLLMTLSLLDGYQVGGAIPVLLSLSSWDPRESPLSAWLAERIGEEYETLRNPARFGRDAPARLLAQGRIIPILDGLDEMAESLQPFAIKGIGEDIQATRPLVLTCRTSDYIAAVREGGHLLSTAQVIEIEDVQPESARVYLAGDVPGGPARWQPVLDAMLNDPEAPISRALSTPLMLWLARTAFDSTDTDPVELLDAAEFSTSASIEDYLLDRFVPATYARDIAHAADEKLRRYPPEKAERWLRNFAQLLYTDRRRDYLGRGRIATDFDFEWWNFFRSATNSAAFTAALILAVPILIVPAVAFLVLTHEANERRILAASIAAAAGLIVAWSYRPASPGRVGKLSRGGLLLRIGDGAQIGAIGAIAVGAAGAIALAVTGEADKSISFGLVAGGTTGATLFIASLFNTPVDTVQARSPGSVMRDDRRAAALIGLISAADAIGLVWWKSGFVQSWAAAWAAAVGGGVGLTSWGWFLIVRMHCFRTRQLPFRLMPFLDDAYRRGVLRQSGSVYQFRHRRLQERLAGVEQPALRPDAEVVAAPT